MSYKVNNTFKVAKKMMSPAAYGYFIRGADDEITLKRNIDAYDQL